MQTLVTPKNRKPKFEVSFKILDLNNIPYVSGKAFVKWRISHNTDHDDRTSLVSVKDHKALFEYEKTTTIRLVVNKTNWLEESLLTLEVVHEVPTAGKPDRSLLGVVKINLAEYVEASRQSGDMIQRRYLLQESKINSTLKVCIRMSQIDGDRNYMAPQLKSAPQFVGIAGIIIGEQMDADETGPTPTVNAQSKEAGEDLRELYKKTLAAELTSQPGEPSADQVIEDIFAGGDGWGPNREAFETSSRRGVTSEDTGTWSDVEARALGDGKGSWPDFSNARRMHTKQASRESMRKDEHFRTGKARGSSFGQSVHRVDSKEWQQPPEVDEMEVREDLKCWLSRPIP
ncbi:hypothetical protein BT63DRAFT_456039 [Microthyrium microscopicum]|uniref:C2 NT-type domain-containing protein n=1 Tax=Microthyrium microscopicum TaxID=703497 RepID=A0A6A6U8V1_9PEZI|nr:hypothetical protein BT63DRAFT_456039 [Microthyrium microscopicum]